MDLPIHGQIFLTKDHSNSEGERQFFSTNDAGTTGYPHEKKMNLDPYHAPYIKLTSNWIIPKLHR